MKIRILLLLLIVTVFSIQAQEMMKGADKYFDKKGRPIKYNIIKTNLLGLAVGHINLKYERKLNKKFSAILDLETPVLGFPLPFLDKVGDLEVTNRLTIRGIIVQPEARLYVGRHGGPRGFFLGIYAPFYQYNLNLNLKSTLQPQSSQAPPIPINNDIKMRVQFMGAGITFGSQHMISSRFSMEWYIKLAAGTLNIKNASYTVKSSSEGRSSSAFSPTSENDVYYSLSPGGTPVSSIPANTTFYANYESSGDLLKESDPPIKTSFFTVMPAIGFTLGYAFGK